MANVYFCLGSNLGDRLQNMRNAVEGLRSFVNLVRISDVYETVPWGPVTDQRFFLNACIHGTAELSHESLLSEIKSLEQRLGRDITTRWGPHNIDIDLLFYDRLVAQVGKHSIPHRQIRQRPFVLRPLADIAPDFVHQIYQMTVTEMLDEVSTAGIILFAPSASLSSDQSEN